MSRFSRRMALLCGLMVYMEALAHIIFNDGSPGSYLTASGKLAFATRAEAYLVIVLIVMVVLVMHNFYCLLRDGETAFGTTVKPKGKMQTEFWGLLIIGFGVGLIWPLSLFVLLGMWLFRLFPQLSRYTRPPSPPTAGVSKARQNG